MRFVFSRKFFILFAIGVVPLSLSWSFPSIRNFVLAADILLIIVAIVDHFISRKLPDGLTITRRIDGRLAIGEISTVSLDIVNATTRTMFLQFKDEVPDKIAVLDPR
ncbi:MAG TPA: hypothetical protein PKA82_12250, partial [Pyrinomonadaceae bacterium]|nr:hypothetical protein [Pyrinomonadaceae bacterium]